MWRLHLYHFIKITKTHISSKHLETWDHLKIFVFLASPKNSSRRPPHSPWWTRKRSCGWSSPLRTRQRARSSPCTRRSSWWPTPRASVRLSTLRRQTRPPARRPTRSIWFVVDCVCGLISANVNNLNILVQKEHYQIVKMCKNKLKRLSIVVKIV